jgi:hypothetical protein
MNSKQSNLGEIRLSVGRLKGAEKMISKELNSEARFNNLPIQLRNEGQMSL